MKLVVDASVAVKWFFHNKAGEQDVAQALNILDALQAGGADAIQPPHWLVESMSVKKQTVLLSSANSSVFCGPFRPTRMRTVGRGTKPLSR